MSSTYPKYFVTPSSIRYGETPNGVAFTADIYSMETREKVGTTNNDGNGGGTYFRPSMDEKSKAATYRDVETEALKNFKYPEQYYDYLMDIAEGVR